MSETQCSCTCREHAPTPADLSVRQLEDRDDFDVVMILLNREDHHGLWSIEELGRYRKDLLGTEDAINRLLRAGLIHQQDEFVFPTRAASRYAQIAW